MDRRYDYVVIGGGAAGCPVASELAKKGPTLLLERGPAKVRNAAIRTCCNKDEVTWHRTEGGSWTATANVLGGGSSINAGVFIQESPQSPFFTQSHPFLDGTRVQKAYADVTQAIAHRRTRPTRVGIDLVSAMRDIGLGNEAVNTNVAHYGIYHPDSLFNAQGVRHSAVDLLPHGGPAAANLVVQTGIRVSRLIFDDTTSTPKVTGFEYSTEPDSTKKIFIQPDAKYILSCGAIHTPRLLMLSGIGNEAELARHNIPVILHQPHVGQHLKDKPVVAISVSSVIPVAETVLDTMGATSDFTIGTASGGTLASYIGPPLLAMIPKSYRTETVRARTARIFQLLPSSLQKKINQQITIYVTLSNPVSEGSVHLSSADPSASPIIQTAGYQAPEEIQAAAKGLNVVSRLIHSPSLAKYIRNVSGITPTLLNIIEHILPTGILSHYTQPVGHKLVAGPLTFPVIPKTECHTPEDSQRLKSWLNDMHAEGWTYTGTCRFDDVVNHDFTVKGIDNLSIVDASVLKRPTRVNGQATMMMLGKYAGTLMTDSE